PSSPGIAMSARRTSGCQRARVASASAAEALVRTSAPAPASSTLRTSRVSAWSSTISTRTPSSAEEGATASSGLTGAARGVAALQANVDAASGGRELDRVVQQVPDHLLQPARVALDQPAVGVDDGPQPDVPGVGGRAHGVDGGLDDRDEADRPHLETELAPD